MNIVILIAFTIIVCFAGAAWFITSKSAHHHGGTEVYRPLTLRYAPTTDKLPAGFLYNDLHILRQHNSETDPCAEFIDIEYKPLFHSINRMVDTRRNWS